jgi:hypothetical protein
MFISSTFSNTAVSVGAIEQLTCTFPSFYLITEMDPVGKIQHVKTLEMIDNVQNKPYLL